MDRHGLSEAEAFSFIQKRAMAERTKMKTVAEQVVIGELALSARAWRKLLLLDGNSLTYRAFFALPTDMATASGQVTNAVFGFTSMLINLLRDNQPDGVVVAFDRPEPTFRHEADRRRTRPTGTAAPDILRQQMGLVRQVVETLGITTVDLPGFEADDIIATLAEQAKARGDEVDHRHRRPRRVPARRGPATSRCSTTAAACPTTRCTTRPASWSAPASRRRSTRSTPRCGATRPTTCPACPGVGEKTAAKLITTYGGLDGIFANLDEQTPKLRASLAEHEERVRRNAGVMVLRRDAPVRASTSTTCTWGPPDMAEVKRAVRLPRVPHRCSTASNEVLGRARSGAGDRRRAGARGRGACSPSARPTRAALLAGSTSLDVAAAWAAPPGRSAAARPGGRGRRRRRPRSAWIPVAHLADAAVRAALD